MFFLYFMWKFLNQQNLISLEWEFGVRFGLGQTFAIFKELICLDLDFMDCAMTSRLSPACPA